MSAGRGLRAWHRWLGLGALLVLVVASVTGTLLAYKKELQGALVAPQAVLPIGLQPIALAAELERIVERVPPSRRDLIKAPNPEEPYWTLTDEHGGVQLLAVGSLVPYTQNRWVLDAFAWLRYLHVDLLAGATGEALLLACGLASVVLTIIGLVLWWPSRARCRWRWVRPQSLRSPLLLQHHRHFGAVVAVPLLVSLLSGSLMLWQKLIGPLGPAAASPQQVATLPAPASPSELLRTALAAVPGAWPTYLRLPTADQPEARIRLRLPGEWHPNGRTSVTVDNASGAVRVSRADQAPAARRLLNQAYPLHSGYGLAALYTLFVAATGLAATWLCVCGAVSWVNRRRARKAVERRPERLASRPSGSLDSA